MNSDRTIGDNERIPMLEPYTVKETVSALSEVVDYNHRMLGIPEMWKKNRGAGVRVAVLDTGCPQHIDLKVMASRDFMNTGSVFDTVAGHSTHVCGIIGALVNGIGVQGIAPDAQLYCGKVLGDDGSGTIEAIAAGIRWAVDEIHADVINMSLGCPPSGAYSIALRSACRYAKEHGVVICAAAGNDAGSVNAPANLSTTIAVAAVDNNRKSAYFTCHGSEVDFAAGGVDVYSTWLNNRYAKLSGTSMATPVITGVVALVIGEAKARGVKLTPDEVYNELVKIAIDVEKPGKDEYTGNGIPVFTSQSDEPTDGGSDAEVTEDTANWFVRLLRKLFRKSK